MSDGKQVRLCVFPLPQCIAWEMRDDERRLGHGSEKLGDWAAVRGVEIRAGVATVEVERNQFLDIAALEAVTAYKWKLSAPAERTAA